METKQDTTQWITLMERQILVKDLDGSPLDLIRTGDRRIIMPPDRKPRPACCGRVVLVGPQIAERPIEIGAVVLFAPTSGFTFPVAIVDPESTYRVITESMVVGIVHAA